MWTTLLACASAGVVVEKHADELTYGGHYIDRYRRYRTENTKSILLSLVAQWHTEIEVYNISYWLFAGSLLGVRCHHGLLPGDTDVDVGMIASDFTRLVALMPKASTDRYDLIVRAGKHSDIIGAKFVDTWNGRFIDVALFYNTNPMIPETGSLVHFWSQAICPECKRNPTRFELSHFLVFPLKHCFFWRN